MKMEIKLSIFDAKKDDSYTGIGRYRVFVNESFQASGRTEIEALENATKNLFRTKELYRNEMNLITEKLQPILSHFNKDEDSDERL